MKWTCVLMILGCHSLADAVPAAGPLDSCNVVWGSPSENAHGSMPLGNGDVGINAWVEANGDLVFYVSKTDAWDENARLCKIGRVRVKFDPPLVPKDGFRQELKLRDGVIEVTSTIHNQPSKILLWVDADKPVVRVEAQSAAPVSCRAEAELWRLGERSLDKADEYGYGTSNNPLAQAHKLAMLPDVVVTSALPQVLWYHRNTRSLYPVCLEVQHLETLEGQFVDPLLNHTFGASMRGVDMVQDGAKALKSAKPAKRHQLSVCVLAERARTPEGELEPETIAMLTEMGKCLDIIGEAVFSTRCWMVADDGDGGISFTRSKDNTVLYVTNLGWSNDALRVRTLGSSRIDLKTLTGVSLLGAPDTLTYTQDAEGLTIKVLKAPFNSPEYAFKLTFSGQIPTLNP
jgi:hypothetical protein